MASVLNVVSGLRQLYPVAPGKTHNLLNHAQLRLATVRYGEFRQSGTVKERLPKPQTERNGPSESATMLLSAIRQA